MAAFETRAETAEEEARRARSRNPETRRDDKLKPFHNYRPPYRILLLELLVIISLITLTLFNPNTFSGGLAISKNAAGTDTVGLLKSCTGTTCTSWLGAPPASGSSSSSSSVNKRQATPNSDTTTSSDSGSNSSFTSTTAFHLQTGLAALCSLIMIFYAFIFHLIRLRDEPPLTGPDMNLGQKNTKGFRKQITGLKNSDFSGTKRFGYRLSRFLTGLNVILLLCVCIASGVQGAASSLSGGFYLLVFAWVFMLMVAIMEYLNDGWKLHKWLMSKRGAMRCGDTSKQRKKPVQSSRTKVDTEQGRRGEDDETDSGYGSGSEPRKYTGGSSDRTGRR